MEPIISSAALVVALLALFVTLHSRQTEQHFYAHSSCSREIGPDGQERDTWQFHSGFANTLIGRTVGRLYIALAHARYQRLVRQSDAASSHYPERILMIKAQQATLVLTRFAVALLLGAVWQFVVGWDWISFVARSCIILAVVAISFPFGAAANRFLDMAKQWLEKKAGLDERFSRLIPEDICMELDRLGITKIEEWHVGSKNLWLTFDKEKGYALDDGATQPLAFSIKRMTRAEVSYASGWKVYLTDFARGYTPEQIIDALRDALPSFEETIQKYRAEQDERLVQMVKAKTAWDRVHRGL